MPAEARLIAVGVGVALGVGLAEVAAGLGTAAGADPAQAASWNTKAVDAATPNIVLMRQAYGPTWGWGWLNIAAGDYVHLIQRSVLLAAAFALAGYFARQAHQHRSLSNSAGSLAVQLQTFEAYLAPVENQEVRDELRKSFGARVFGDHPAMKGEPTVAPTAAAMDTAVEWAAKLTAGGK